MRAFKERRRAVLLRVFVTDARWLGNADGDRLSKLRLRHGSRAPRPRQFSLPFRSYFFFARATLLPAFRGYVFVTLTVIIGTFIDCKSPLPMSISFSPVIYIRDYSPASAPLSLHSVHLDSTLLFSVNCFFISFVYPSHQSFFLISILSCSCSRSSLVCASASFILLHRHVDCRPKNQRRPNYRPNSWRLSKDESIKP